VSLVVAATVVAGGILVGRIVGRRLRSLRQATRPSGETGAEHGALVDPLAGFACNVGDVVVRHSERDEAWLAGALVLSEEHPAAALFIAPEAGGDHALYLDAPTRGTLSWLTPIADGALAVRGEPPHAIEHEGVRFVRLRRLPVRVRGIGEHVPAFGESAIVGEYAGPGAARLVVLAGEQSSLAWRGTVLSDGEYEVLPGGASGRAKED
jgi:hypothetical protein